MMRYFLRAVKYFIQMSVILALVIGILMVSGMVDKDINKAFSQGWTSVGWIALMLGGFSALYPMLGYRKRTLDASKAGEDPLAKVQEALEERGYRLERQENNQATFRSQSVYNRITRLGEDRITATLEGGTLTLEGLARDLARITLSVERKLL